MRNFDSIKAGIAKGDAPTIRLATFSDIAANAMSAHRVALVSHNACRRSFQLRSNPFSRGAADNLVNSAGLTLMGYPDTSGAPSANLRR